VSEPTAQDGGYLIEWRLEKLRPVQSTMKRRVADILRSYDEKVASYVIS
jgi:hypothetical protein